MLVPLLTCAPLALGPDREIDFKGLAQEYLRRHETSPTNLRFEDLRRDHFVTTSVGAFDISFPRTALESKVDLRDLRQLGEALCDAQLNWLAVAGVQADELERAGAEAEQLRAWISDWRAPDLLAGADADGGRFAPDPNKRRERHAATAAFAERVRSCSWLGDGARPLEPIGLMLVPERADFLGLVATLGWIDPDLRSKLWLDDLPVWTFFRYYSTHVLALRFAASEDGDIRQGVRMDSRNDDGMKQHVVQLALRALVDRVFGDRMSPAFNAGLSANLVIDQFGEVDTRTDGDLRARETQPRSMFVPGGAPNGGTLPAKAADSPWRLPDQGGDHFVAVLRESQKAASRSSKKSSERNLRFRLRSDDGKDELAISAPFMIPLPWRGSLPGPEFRGDQLEFLRCYRCAFVHWMRTAADGKRSTETFSRWLRELASGAGDLNAVTETLYGVPVSEDKVGKKSLEGRFLRWLAKR